MSREGDKYQDDESATAGRENECGLFAIVFATALANGVQPGHCVFKQRQHLYLLRSLEEKVLSMFPVEKMKRGRVDVHFINSIEMFCSCRMPIEGK